ncbi:MAG: hypothetical protein Fur005_23130 [Roseiflexaceae bacterium]
MAGFDQATFLALLQHADLALIRLSADGIIQHAEGAALRWFSQTVINGRVLAQLIDPPEHLTQLLTTAQTHGQAKQRLRLINGEATYLVNLHNQELTNPSAIPNSDRIWDVLCTAQADGSFQLLVHDLTERVNAEIVRDELIKGIRGLLWHADISIDGEAVSWNFKLVNEDVGPTIVPLDIPEGLSWGQVWVGSRLPEDNERMNRVSTEALLQGWEHYSQTFRCRANDGSIRWLREDVQITRLSPTRWRMVGICTNITELQEQERRLREFELLANNALDSVFMFNQGGVIRYANPAAAEFLHYESEADLLGKTFEDIVIASDYANIQESIRTAFEQGQGWRGTTHLRCSYNHAWAAQISVFPLTDDAGTNWGSAVIASDLSAQQIAEQERQKLQDQLIATQQATLRELSTPLIPLADGLIAMPLVGTIDANRAQMVMETLLEGISRLQAEAAILDITGVRMVDTQVADALVRVARAAQLLGARVIITGVSPEVAQSLVQLGADLRGITTLTNLQAGIAFALRTRS